MPNMIATATRLAGATGRPRAGLHRRMRGASDMAPPCATVADPGSSRSENGIRARRRLATQATTVPAVQTLAGATRIGGCRFLPWWVAGAGRGDVSSRRRLAATGATQPAVERRRCGRRTAGTRCTPKSRRASGGGGLWSTGWARGEDDGQGSYGERAMRRAWPSSSRMRRVLLSTLLRASSPSVRRSSVYSSGVRVAKRLST